MLHSNKGSYDVKFHLQAAVPDIQRPRRLSETNDCEQAAPSKLLTSVDREKRLSLKIESS